MMFYLKLKRQEEAWEYLMWYTLNIQTFCSGNLVILIISHIFYQNLAKIISMQ